MKKQCATLVMMSKLSKDEVSYLQEMAKISRCEDKIREGLSLSNINQASLEINTLNETRYLPIFKQINVKQGFVTYEWSEAGKEVLEYIKDAPPRIYLAQSGYTIQLYILLQEYLKKARKQPCIVEIDVSKIREHCQCQDKYISFNQFKNRVIDKALDELQQICNVPISYSYVKNGKQIKTMRFTIGDMTTIKL